MNTEMKRESRRYNAQQILTGMVPESRKPIAVNVALQ